MAAFDPRIHRPDKARLRLLPWLGSALMVAFMVQAALGRMERRARVERFLTVSPSMVTLMEDGTCPWTAGLSVGVYDGVFCPSRPHHAATVIP